MSYGWKTRHYKLTKDQQERGVIFSAQIVNYSINDPGDLHEVFDSDPDKWQKIENLRDVSFFKSMARDFGWRCECIHRS